MTLRDLIKRHEGVRLKVYLDTKGIPTIGVGRNLRDRGISQGEAELLLSNDLHAIIGECERRIDGFPEFDEVRRAVLVDIAFNCGAGGLLKFQRMLSALRAGHYDRAAAEIVDSTLAPERAKELAQMMRSGEWPV